MLVTVHDPHVIFFVDVLLHLETLFERMNRVFKVFPLVFVLFLDIRIDFNIFGTLVLDVFVQMVIDSTFQLVVVVNILNNCVYSILVAVDIGIVYMDHISCSFDMLLESFLSGSQVVNHETEVCICLIEASKFFIHRICPLFQSHNFHFTWSNITSQFLNFIIKNKLEFK